MYEFLEGEIQTSSLQQEERKLFLLTDDVIMCIVTSETKANKVTNLTMFPNINSILTISKLYIRAACT